MNDCLGKTNDLGRVALKNHRVRFIQTFGQGACQDRRVLVVIELEKVIRFIACGAGFREEPDLTE